MDHNASCGDRAITFTMSRTAVSIATLGASGSMLGSEQLGSCDAPMGVLIRLDIRALSSYGSSQHRVGRPWAAARTATIAQSTLQVLQTFIMLLG